MPAKRFGAVDLTANTDTVLFQATGQQTVADVRFCNRNEDYANAWLAIVDASAATALANIEAEDWIEFNSPIAPKDILENSKLVIPTGFSVVVRSSVNNVNVVAYGFEERC